MRYCKQLLSGLSSVMVWLAGAALLLMMLLVVADIVSKYAFNQPVPGTLEFVAFYGMVACVFLPIAAVQKMDGHIMVTMFTDRLPHRILPVWCAVVNLAGAAYLLLFAWASAGAAIGATTIGESTSVIALQTVVELRTWPARWWVPLAAATMAGWLIVQAVAGLRRPRGQ